MLYTDPLVVEGREIPVRFVIDRLRPYVSEARQARIAQVLDERTYTVATVVEGLYDQGNVSAVMRSAEALGFQPFHIIETGDDFKQSSRVTQGADKWLDVFQWTSARDCVDYLKQQGYTVAVTHLDASVPIQTLNFTKPTALVFGNEAEGVSEEMLALADVRCVIPMVGFVQSFNISVAGAISLYHAYQERVRRQGYHGDLTEQQKAVLTAVFYLKSVKHHARILERLMNP